MALSCSVCTATFEHKSELILHKKEHGGNVFTCHLCHKPFNDRCNLTRHVKGVHEKVANHKCQICGSSFKQKTHLQAHYTTHTQARDFLCGVCGKKFARQVVLETHMRIHKKERPFKCDICPAGFNHKHNLMVHMNKHSGDANFTCSYCGRTFYRKNNYVRHLYVHTNDRPFICGICSKNFIYRCELDTHVRTYHPIEKADDGSISVITTHRSVRHHKKNPYIFDCKECDKVYNASQNLQRHIRAMHGWTTEKFECKYCDRPYTRQSFLDEHIKSKHASEDPELADSLGSVETKRFQCKTCDTKFTLMSSLKKHLRNVHNRTLKKFVCKYCNDFSSEKMRPLDKHIRRHHAADVSGSDEYSEEEDSDEEAETDDDLSDYLQSDYESSEEPNDTETHAKHQTKDGNADACQKSTDTLEESDNVGNIDKNAQREDDTTILFLDVCESHKESDNTNSNAPTDDNNSSAIQADCYIVEEAGNLGTSTLSGDDTIVVLDVNESYEEPGDTEAQAALRKSLLADWGF